MVVELISVGTEILMGNIINTNAAYLSEQCVGLGLSCYYQQVVGDNWNRMVDALKLAMSRSDIVIMSGGLGPTEDDMTKEVAAEVCGLKLVEDAKSRQALIDFFNRRGIVLTDNNWKQAMVPEGCIVIDNPYGTAPGIIIEKEECRIILLPGPPNEMIPLFTESVKPYLEKLTDGVIYSVTIKETGIGESQAEDMILDLIDAQNNPTIATYAKTSEVHIRISACGRNQTEAQKIAEPIVAEIKKRFGNHVYTDDENITLEQSVAELIRSKGYTFTCVESCTGGMLAGRMVSVRGISDIFRESYVTYANESKNRILGVSDETLANYGAVSEQCAAEMAMGASRVAGSEVAVSITGIAGPDGGTEDKPVGTVYIGCCVCGKVQVKKYCFKGDRAKVREHATSSAISFMRSCIMER